MKFMIPKPVMSAAVAATLSLSLHAPASSKTKQEVVVPPAELIAFGEGGPGGPGFGPGGPAFFMHGPTPGPAFGLPMPPPPPMSGPMGFCIGGPGCSGIVPDLTDDQMSQLAAIKRQSRAAAATKMGKVMDLQTQLERLSTADQIDEDALRRVFNELSTLRSDVAKEMFNEKIASMKVLTVAQRKQLRNELDRRELGIPPLPRQMPPPGSRPSPPAP